MIKVEKERFLHLLPTYAVDWLVLIILGGICFGIDQVEPFKREFSVNDETISYPLAPAETLSMLNCILVTALGPFIIISLVAVFLVKSGYDWHQAVLGLALSCVLTLLLTEILKITVGRHRPDFLSRCNLPSGTKNPEFGLLTIKNCRQASKTVLLDGLKSFPSGHSSQSFAGLTFLSLYLAGKLRVFDGQGYPIKLVLTLAPVLLAMLIAISRTTDYRHHWQDVTIGSFIGFSMAFISYRQYYHSLAAPEAGKPYSPRRVRKGKKNEEAGGEVGAEGYLEEV